MNKYNFNNLKNFLANNSVATIISILALFIAISSSNTPCLSANSVCTSGTDPEYTNNLSLKAGTTNKATFTHNTLLGDNQYFFPESNYSRTSSVAILKKGTDQTNILDLNNGSIIIGQSVSSTIGNLRVQTSSLPVLQMYGNTGWQAVGVSSPDQNVFTSISGNTGSLTASTTTTAIKLEASADSGLTVVASGDKLEIQSSGGGSTASAGARFLVSSGYTHTTQNDVMYDTENYDIDGCWTINTTASDTTLEYTCATTRAFVVNSWLGGDGSIVYEMEYRYQVNSGATQIGYFGGRDFPASAARGIGGTATVCLNQNDEFHSKWGNATSGNSIYGGLNLTAIEFHEDTELTAYAASQTCTDGLFN